MKIYHYTSFESIGAILGKQGNRSSGLEPRSKIGGPFSSYESPQAIFGLLEPTPHSWVNNPYFTKTWLTLIRDLLDAKDRGLLLEVEVSGERDKAFVGERAHFEGNFYTDTDNIPSQFLYEHQSDAEKAFVASMTPLEVYDIRQKEGRGFCLPEVVILNAVAPEQIRVSHQQPLLEKALTRTHSEERDHLLYLITLGWAHRELTPWKQRYEGVHGPLAFRTTKERS